MGKGGGFWRYVLLAAALAVGPAAAQGAQDADTLEELAALAGNEACRGCHGEIHRQWQASWHSRSVASSVGVTSEFLESVRKDWNATVSKAQLEKCFHCHAPVFELASERLALEIGELVVTAAKKRGSPEGEDALAKLGGISIGCTDCHNRRATAFITGLAGAPRPGAVYGPAGKASTAHETVAAPQLRRAFFCIQCHGSWTAPDGELITCASIPGSYQNAYLSQGGAKACQDCHMRADGRGHAMPGGHDIDMVRAGLGLRVEVESYLHLPGKVPGVKDGAAPVPSAVVTAFVENRAGHRVPDG